MVRNRRLIEFEPRREVANANFVFASSERREDRKSRGVGECSKERCFRMEVAIVNGRFGTATLNRHSSILAFESISVNAKGRLHCEAAARH